MNKSDWDELVEALTKDAGGSVPEVLWKAEKSKPASIEQLVTSITGRPVEDPAPLQSASAARPSSDDGIGAADVVRTIGKYSGISPVITGLFKLFGGGGDRDSGVAPLLFAVPRPVSVEAGLTQDRSVRSISYGQQGAVRADSPAPAPAPVQITVQAMDSKSFLDHRDEIARAVREAMLHSHSLNDVVSEL